MQELKSGRKSMPNKREIIVAFSEDVIATMDAEAGRLAVPNRSEIVRQAVAEYLSRRQRETAQA